jgi:NitT/TauT family transport system substrate-binding protein
MNERGIVFSGDAERLGIGAMTDARWEAFYNAMRDAEVMPPGLDVKRAYSLRFVNRRAGLA